MAWQKVNVNGPIISDIASAAGTAATVIGAAASVAQSSKGALDAISKVAKPTKDLFSPLYNSVINEFQTLANDLFATGVYMLTVNPFDVPGNRQKDSFGIPFMYPREALQMAIDSFDDLGDGERPQFSDSANVAGFGFLATMPNLSGFLSLIEDMLKVFTIPDWQFAWWKMLNASEAPATVQSQYPDWRSIRFNSIKPFSDLQKSMNNVLNNLEGNQVTADSNLNDLANMINKKKQEADRVVNELNDLLDNMEALGSASGLYVLDIDEGVGGNTRLKEEIFDCDLAITQTQYTICAIFVGGGLGVTPIQKVKGYIL